MTPDRIQDVGAGVGGLGQPRDRTVDAVGLVAVLAEEQVGARVDHHMHPGGVGGGPQRADELGVLAGRPQPPALAVHGVLDVEADRTGAEQAVDETGGRLAVSGFDVDGDRDVAPHR